MTRRRTSRTRETAHPFGRASDDEEPPLTRDNIAKALDVVRNVRSRSPGVVLDLEGMNLSGLDLHGLDLSVATLRGADLSRADLQGVNLHGADLQEAAMIETSLQHANLSNACLYRANLFGVNFCDANLTRVNMGFANLSGAGLYQANLQNADLRGAQFNGVNMRRAILRGANLLFTTLNGVELEETDFTDAVLSFTVLAGLDLSRVSGLGSVKHDAPAMSTLIQFDSPIGRLRRSSGPDVVSEIGKSGCFACLTLPSHQQRFRMVGGMFWNTAYGAAGCGGRSFPTPISTRPL